MQQLDSVSLRVLGSLMEKEMTTPESYPLSLNALVNACNQRSSRDPVMDLGEEEVRQGIHVLEDLALVSAVRDARVPKYEHRVRTVLNLRRDETALLCLLLLRGPQTPGELRSRADRLHSFDELAAVQATLERMAARTAEAQGNEVATGPLTTVLRRQPGSREVRYAHLLGGPPDLSGPAAAVAGYGRESAAAPVSASERIAQLEAEVAALAMKLEALEARVDGLTSGSEFARANPLSP